MKFAIPFQAESANAPPVGPGRAELPLSPDLFAVERPVVIARPARAFGFLDFGVFLIFSGPKKMGFIPHIQGFEIP